MRLSRKRLGVVVLYHAIGSAQGDPRSELVPVHTEGLFRKELRHLKRSYVPVPLSEFREAIAARKRGGRFPVCVTFDDDLPSHADTALPMLAEEHVLATFFLCGASLLAARSFWWERLQRAVDAGYALEQISALLPNAARPGAHHPTDIHEMAELVRGLGSRETRAFDQRLLEFAGPDPAEAGLRRNAVSALVGAGHTIGFHTLEHLDLTRLSDTELFGALRNGRVELERLTGRPITAIAYPYGRADSRVATGARAAGYAFGFTASSRPAADASDPLLLGRLVMDSVESLGEFALRLGVLLLSGSRGQ